MTTPLPGVWRAALALVVEHGLAVLPLRPGAKVPATTHGVHDASTHPEQLERWAGALPAAGLGVACGGLLRLLVVDVDGPEGEAALARFGPLPRTWEARTPKGGRHLYFTAPAEGPPLGNSARTLGPELDTRGVGGYVVAAPTVLADGRRYTWAPGRSPDDLERAPLPAAIVTALRAPRMRAPATPRPERPASNAVARTDDITRLVAAYMRKLPPLADGQGRNLTAFRLAAFVLHDCGGSAGDAGVTLRAWNARNLEPLADDALVRAVENAARYGGRRHAA
jgi:hypothetical protein